MQVSTYYQIKGQSTPSTSATPALATVGGKLHMIYIGQGGSNVWWVQSSDATNPNSWTNNQQVKLNATRAVTTNDNTITAVGFQNQLGFPWIDGKGSLVNYSWFDGNQWQVDDVTFEGSFRYDSPVAIVVSGTLYLFVGSDRGLRMATRTVPMGAVDANRWMVVDTGYGATPLSATADDSGRVILMTTGPATAKDPTLVMYLVVQPSVPVNWARPHTGRVETANQNPLITTKATIFANWGGFVGFVYLAQGKGTTLYSASLNTGNLYAEPAPNMLLSPSSEVLDPTGKPAQAQSPPAMIGFGGHVVLAHQGASGGNIWVATTNY